MTRRVYLPLTAADLDALAAGQALAAGRDAYTVTDEVRAELPGADEEELEYDAFREAAHAAGGAAAPARRVIGSADLPGSAVTTPAQGYAGVITGVPVTIQELVSLHVDETAEHRDEDLLWYDIAELADVRALLR